MNTQTRAALDTLKQGLPWAWVPVLFVWIAWTLITAMNDQTPPVINFLVSGLLSIMLTVVAVLVQYCVVSFVQYVRSQYKDKLCELEAKQRQQEIDRRTAEMFPTEQEIKDATK